MTNYLPDLSEGSGPIYLKLANRLEADMHSGALPAGAKLPPQRDLAFDIGVTIGTVGRAYSLLRERGLVSGEVGRGTYVLDRHSNGEAAVEPLADAGDRQGRYGAAPTGKLPLDSTAAPHVGQSEQIARTLAGITQELSSEMLGYARNFPDRWMQAGQQWLSRGNYRPEVRNIVPTIGAHAAVVAAIAAVTMPGDYIAFEQLTYSQISRSSSLIGRRILQMRSDEHGLIPEDFEHLCAQRHPKLAFLMPAAHNPTATVMPEARRREIAEIARRFNVWLIEDDLYGAMAGGPEPLVAEFAPERTFVVNGLSKSVGAGLRGGWVACPEHQAQAVRIAHKMTTGGLPFILAELASRLVLSGDAQEIRRKCLAEVNARLAIARNALEGFDFRTIPNIPFIWIALPEPWLSGTFKNAAYNEGVLIDDEDEFKAGRLDHAFHRVRVGITTVSRSDAEEGLQVVRRLLDSGGARYDSYS